MRICKPVRMRQTGLTSIICVLHDRHELNDIVPQIPDTRERIACELLVCADPILGSRDPDVCLVYACALWGRGPLVLELVPFGRRRVPEARLVDWGYLEILGDPRDPGGQAFDAFA